jgi:hypothetical protein
MAENNDPYVGDPMLITPMSQDALMKAALNPYLDPDTTPPEEARAISARVREQRGQQPLTVPAFELAPEQAAASPSPPSAHLEHLSDEERRALELLKEHGIIEQTNGDTWRFK